MPLTSKKPVGHSPASPDMKTAALSQRAQLPKLRTPRRTFDLKGCLDPSKPLPLTPRNPCCLKSMDGKSATPVLDVMRCCRNCTSKFYTEKGGAASSYFCSSDCMWSHALKQSDCQWG